MQSFGLVDQGNEWNVCFLGEVAENSFAVVRWRRVTLYATGFCKVYVCMELAGLGSVRGGREWLPRMAMGRAVASNYVAAFFIGFLQPRSFLRLGRYDVHTDCCISRRNSR